MSSTVDANMLVYANDPSTASRRSGRRDRDYRKFDGVRLRDRFPI